MMTQQLYVSVNPSVDCHLTVVETPAESLKVNHVNTGDLTHTVACI